LRSAISISIPGSVIAENLDNLGQRLAVRRRLLDHFGDDDLPGPRAAAHIGRDQDVLADALVFRDQVPDASLFVDAADDFAIGPLEHIDDRAFRPAAAVDADDPRGRAIAVQRLVHLLRRQKQIRAAVVGNEKSEAVGVALHRSGHQVELGNDAKLAFAVGHQLAVALHRRQTAGERFALGLAVHAEELRQLFGGHRHALLAQRLQYLFAFGNRDIAARAAGAAAGRGFGGRADRRSGSRRDRRRAIAWRHSLAAGCSFGSAADRGGVALLF